MLKFHCLPARHADPKCHAVAACGEGGELLFVAHPGDGLVHNGQGEIQTPTASSSILNWAQNDPQASAPNGWGQQAGQLVADLWQDDGVASFIQAAPGWPLVVLEAGPSSLLIEQSGSRSRAHWQLAVLLPPGWLAEALYS
jgi:hypothetical protein